MSQFPDSGDFCKPMVHWETGEACGYKKVILRRTTQRNAFLEMYLHVVEL